LVESYQTDTVEQMIILEYALTNSIDKVIENLKNQGVKIGKEAVVEAIKSKPADELHRIIRKGYIHWTKMPKSIP
jgi:hypothetical protein